MKSDPTLSIALLTHNRGTSGMLGLALEAILGQTYGDFELLVLDNHSSDETADIVLSHKDRRLIYVRQPPGRNPEENHKSAIWMSRGDYVLPTHDDDIMEPSMIESQMRYLRQHPDTLALATNVSLIGESGELLQPRLYEMNVNRRFGPGEYMKVYFDEKLWLPTPTYIHQSKNLRQLNKASTRAKTLEYRPSGDILGMMIQNSQGPIALLAEPLLRYRQHPAQESRNVDQSAPLYHLALALAQQQRTSHMRPLVPVIQGALARFHTQHLLFALPPTAPLHRNLRRNISKILSHWQNRVRQEERITDVVLPFVILAMELGLDTGIDPSKLCDDVPSANHIGPLQTAYRQWTGILAQGGHLFSGFPHRRIAVFGSMLTAFLICADAQQCGIEVVCCLDSSPARIGKHVFDVPIIPLSDISRVINSVDGIVLSSERNHEEALRQILVKALDAHEPPVPILSWKDLARRCAIIPRQQFIRAAGYVSAIQSS